MSDSPEISIVVVSYHSRSDLGRLLPSLEQNIADTGSAEVIIVDNAQEATLEAWLQADYPWVRYLLNPANTGYAGGNNVGIDAAKGEWIFILNPDTVLHKGALKELRAAAQAAPEALINPLILNPDGTIYACGNTMHYTGVTSCFAQGDAAEGLAEQFSIPLLSGTAFIAKKSVLTELGRFEERYFTYLEDTDLSLRARAAGRALYCVSSSRLTHHTSLGVQSSGKFYYLERNRLFMILTLFESKTLLTAGFLLTELATWSFAFLKHPSYARMKLKGYHWLFKHRRLWLERRRRFQAHRLRPDAELLERATNTLPLAQLMTNKRLAGLVNDLTLTLYAPLRPYNIRKSS